MGIYKAEDRHGVSRFVVSRYWPRKSGRVRIYTPNRQSARALLLRIENAISDGTWPNLKRELSGEAVHRPTLEEFSKRFLEERCKPRMRSWKDYERNLQKVNHVLGSIFMDEFRRRDLYRYIEIRRKEVCGATVNRHIAAVKVMFSYAVDVEVLEHHPLVRFRLLPEQRKSFRPLTVSEYRHLIECMPNTRTKGLVAVLGETGLRKSEALFLRWDNVDLANRIVSTDQTKNYKARQIPLSEFAISWLGQLVRYVNCPFVFVNPKTGERWRSARKSFEEGRERAGLNVGFHDLRRFRASQWLASGLDVRTVQELLGHKDVRTTMIYLGLSRHVVDAVRQAQASEQRELEKMSAPGNKQATGKQ